jgi:glycosyltransferase involved in cell wall biosynthesis
VYKSIVPYLERVSCSNYELAYNVLPGDHLTKKDDYRLRDPVRVISVGRHYVHKNPENIIRAVGNLSNVHLTLVGDGPYQERLQGLVSECGLEDRVTFIPAIPNSKLSNMLCEHDIFAVHVEAFGISKTVLEALLVGMPVIINRRMGAGGQVPELEGDFVMMVDNTSDGYSKAIVSLMENDVLREQQGRKAFAHAQENWASAKTEMKYVEVYKKVMSQAKQNVSS